MIWQRALGRSRKCWRGGEGGAGQVRRVRVEAWKQQKQQGFAQQDTAANLSEPAKNRSPRAGMFSFRRLLEDRYMYTPFAISILLVIYFKKISLNHYPRIELKYEYEHFCRRLGPSREELLTQASDEETLRSSS